MGKVATALVPILMISLVGTAYWGYKEHQAKNALLIKAENQYQREFHNISFYMDQLEAEIAKSLAVNSRKQISSNLTKVWRLAYSAQNSLGQLPLTFMPFNKTEAFLSRIGEFTYKTAIRDLDKEPLTEKEWQTLQALHKSASEIKADLDKVQDEIVNKRLRWMDVETILATGDKKKQDNSIIAGFKLIDKRVAGYEDLETSLDTQNSEEVRMEKLKKLSGTDISEEKAKEIALSFVGADHNVPVNVTKNSEKAMFPAYIVHIEDKQTNTETMVEVTKKGGHVIWMLHNRNINQGKMSLTNAQVRAERFLKSKQIDSMELVKIEQYDHEAMFTFVRNENGIRIYPDTIILKVALDDGEVIGYHAEGHVVNQHLKSFSKPVITLEEAKENINPNLKVEEENLALIVNDLNEEVLCYEFSGKIGDSYFRIYINADTGEEERVEKLEYTKS